MPSWLSSYLDKHDLSKHFRRALVLGFVLRSVCAWFVYGPQALDDYKHGVYPAYQYFAGLPLDLPEYRSHLLVWLLAGFTKIASWFGVASALGQVRAMYFGLGCLSLLTIVGTYKFVVHLASRREGALALYMAAAYPLLPFVGTRAFGEAVALAFVVYAFGTLEKARRGNARGWAPYALGFASLGVAVLFRFHVGILYVTYAGVLLYLRVWPGLIGALIAGLFTLGAQVGIDLLSGKGPLETLLVYMAENEGGAVKYGVSPWYNTWAFVLVVTLAPFSLVLARYCRVLWRQQWTILIPLLVFVTAHSLVPHKEERFLYPIVGLEVWAVACLWAAAAADKWAKRVFAPAILGLGGVLLAVMCFVNTQEGEIEPPAYIQSRYGNVTYLDYESLFGASRFQFYFLRPPSELKPVLPEEFTATRIDDELESNRERHAVALLTSDPAASEKLRALAGVRTLSAQCRELRQAGSLVDRLLYKLNPKHNQRRRPTWYLTCERISGV